MTDTTEHWHNGPDDHFLADPAGGGEWVKCASDPCESVKAGEKPDMRMGDTCLMCLCRECERCGKSIDLDEENQIKDGQRGPAEFQGYWDVCDDCLLDSDVLYDDELEAERRLEMA